MTPGATGWRAPNRAVWDERVRRKDWYIDTATPEDFRQPLKVADPLGWLGDVTGKRVLCLAAGGGRHGPLLGSAGAIVTVVDLSPAMLALDRKLAAERGLTLALVEASMTDLSALADASFDTVIQPVSTCYVPDVVAVYREVARVLRPGGIYASQHKQPISLQATAGPVGPRNQFVIAEPYDRAEPLPPAGEGCWHREAGAVEYLHRLEDLLGGMCRTGFIIEDVIEPRQDRPEAAVGTFAYRCRFVPPYLAIKARRTDGPLQSPVGGGLLVTH